MPLHNNKLCEQSICLIDVCANNYIMILAVSLQLKVQKKRDADRLEV